MNSFLRLPLLLATAALPARAANIAPLGTGLLGSNDTTITDTGSSHANAGTVANIRDGNFTTRVDNYQTGQAANVNGFVGISWATARTDVVKSLTLTMACFVDGGWFGNQESPLRSRPLTPDMLVAPVVQVSTNLTAWTTVPATVNYVSAFNGHVIAGDNTPTSRAFNITLAQWQTGIRGIRIIGATGGYGDGNGFIGVFELEVNADAITDADTDGMDDAWEAANGLAAGTNDGALDADSDGLSNALEFRWQSNPQQPDSDGDGLTDGAEHTTHLTWPTMADTDGDALSDAAEINTHSTNANIADTDGDGLSDAAEINTHLTTATNRDTDSDGFPDGIEIQLVTDPLSAASRPPDAARAGTAILGTGTSSPRGAAGRTAHLNDGDGITLANTNATPSFAGIVWPTAWPQPVASMEVTLATSDNAGWFGTANTLAGYGSLPALNLTAPALQTTTDGTTWTTVPTGNYTTDYITRFTGHAIGGLGCNDATRRSAVFTFNAPVAGLRGIRVSGACRTNLCVSDIKVVDSTNTADTDADGLSNAQEVIAGTSALHSDSDGDGLSDGAEVNTHNTNPLLGDTDADYFPDGLEVREDTAPVSAAAHPANLSLAGSGILGVTPIAGYLSIYPTNTGTMTFNSGNADNIVDGYNTTRVDAWNGSITDAYDLMGVRFGQRVQAAELKVQFATFNHAGWYGTNASPGAGGTLTAAHLVEPRVQVTYNNGVAWYDVPATSNYITQLTGHVIAGADNLPTRTPVVTFTLLSPATGINGIRLMGREGGNPDPFVGVFDFAVTPAYVTPETSVTLNTVTVGDPGNPAHPSGLGRVNYTFQIAATETSLRDYCAFLNAVAAEDPNGLWNPAMATDRQTGGILRLGASGSFQYHVMGDGRRPVTHVSWTDAARFVNWLHNGQGSGSTESGAYALGEPLNLSIGQTRQAGATVALPTRDEWLKAACYDPAKPGWWNYAMKADTLPPNTTGGNYLDASGNWAATQTFSGSQPSTSLTTPGGFYSASPSAYGTFDQTGNVWEFTENDTGTLRTAVGESWWDVVPRIPSATSERVTQVTEESGITGFRVVLTAPAPALFAAAPVSGKANVWVGGADGGAGYNAGPNFVPNNTTSFHPAADSFTGGVPFISATRSYWNAINGPGSISNNGTATVAPGKIEVIAGNASPTDQQFFGGFAHGGWEETMQVNVPGRAGESAWLLLNIKVTAGLNAGPARGACSFRLGISVENGAIPSSPPGLVQGSSSGIYPNLAWSNTNFNSALWDNDFINETITAPIPVVIGQRFRLRVYGLAHAGLGAVTSLPPSASSVNASARTVGFAGLLENPLTFPIPGYTVLSASGTPYSQTLPPVKLGVDSAAMSFLPNGQIQLTWPSLAGQEFTFDSSSDLNTWLPMPGTITATGDTTSRLITPAPGEQRSFYRPWRLF